MKVHALLRQKLLHDLVRQVPTEVILHELVERTITGQNGVTAPRSLLQLICAMGAALETQQRFDISNSLRDAADLLERECV